MRGAINGVSIPKRAYKPLGLAAVLLIAAVALPAAPIGDDPSADVGELEWRSRRSVSSPENKLNSMDVNEEALVDARAQTAPQMLFGGRD